MYEIMFLNTNSYLILVFKNTIRPIYGRPEFFLKKCDNFVVNRQCVAFFRQKRFENRKEARQWK